ncbi:aldehyde dehydrogenase [Flagellimonas lutaonensis]|uniref:Aldehyde dehydrogenase n=1 Tax=Flagellimonas lutaonensis TaxID=516051 RepID=A0A0D5YTN2_9FLAO|nr:aldehyde dehydrogenase [Allomuricauda lutaonensis]AKA35223.1 Aldehyde dehydrogenase [Allomuricauda lutaonensis]
MGNSSISEVINKQRDFFKEGKTKDVSFRKKALKKLQRAIIAQENAICEALYKDLKKPKFECLATETQLTLSELRHAIKNIDLWSRPKRAPPSLSNFPSSDWIHYEPYGNVLIIAPWNYPFQLTVAPLIGAIAAGNTAVLKPSEFTPHTTAIISQIMKEVFEEGHVTVKEGGVEVSQALLKEKWDYIFFTGSTRVGKIVYKSAAEHLIPVTLELGGKSPCIVDGTAPLKLAAKRICWGKFLNAGQTCIAPDYILVHKTVKDKLVGELKKAIIKSYGENIRNSADYGRIISKEHYTRLKEMLEGEDILFGGTFDDGDVFLGPTLLNESDLESKAMQEEIFGPILPIISYETEADIERYLNHFGKPLALYVFSRNKNFQKKIIQQYSFGGGVINDTVIQITNKRLPFGGVGASGIGSYHGKHSFELFSHKKAIIKKANWLDIPLRYAPYTLAERWVKKFKHLL